MFLKIILVIYLIVMTILTFFMYAIDKRRAIKGKNRISEAVLLTMSIIGGALGGYLAMIIKHHKTKHWYFMLINILGVVGYGVLLYFIFR